MDSQLSNSKRTLQDRFNRLSSSTSLSRIPVLTNRNASTPIAQIADLELGPNPKKTQIPRIISSPGLSHQLDSNQYLTTYSNRPSPILKTPRTDKIKDLHKSPSTVTNLSTGLDLLSLSTPLPKRHSSVMNSSKTEESPTIRYQKSQNSQNPIILQKISTRNISNGVPLSKDMKNRAVSSPHIPTSSRIYRTRHNPLERAISESPSKPQQTRVLSTNPVKTQLLVRKNNNPLDVESNPFLRLSRSTASRNLKMESIQSTSLKGTITRQPIQSKTLSHSTSLQSNLNSATSSIRTNDSTVRSTPITFSTTIQPLPQSKLSGEPPIIRTTQSSRLKVKQKTLTVQEMSPLVIPKKRPLTKSVSTSGDLNGFANSPSIKRVASISRNTSSSGANRLDTNRRIQRSPTSKLTLVKTTQQWKLSTQQELFTSLSKFSKTSRVANSWDSAQALPSHPVQNSLDILQNNTLTSFERAELSKHEKIYYIGSNTGNLHNSSLALDSSQNFGYDDKNNNLNVAINDHINYRYQVVSNLGFGMFGNVLRCNDHRDSKIVSLKVMKNDINWQLQSLNEIKILRSLKGHPNILSYMDHFNFRSHICVVTELLAVNLIEALEATNFKGFELNIIKLWSRQLLSGLNFLKNSKIIHCDLKPENIMLVSPHSFDLKIIDFGSSTYEGEQIYPYIQSRFYRAPEVLIGARYNFKIDIWSFGCVIYEMYKGVPLFPAKDELDLYKMFVKLLGNVSPRAVLNYRNEIIQKGSISSSKSREFIDKKTILFTCFDRLGTYNGVPLPYSRREPFSRKLGIDDERFIKFLENILVWNQAERYDAEKLIKHDFLRN